MGRHWPLPPYRDMGSKHHTPHRGMGRHRAPQWDTGTHREPHRDVGTLPGQGAPTPGLWAPVGHLTATDACSLLPQVPPFMDSSTRLHHCLLRCQAAGRTL